LNLQLFHQSDNGDDDEEEEEEEGGEGEEDESITGGSLTESQSSDNLSNTKNPSIHISQRRRTIDPNGMHALRTYVSHRKDTIVQRVIGYNYDDHSTAGGLYIRVGIGSK
jgi:hypothetical protein